MERPALEEIARIADAVGARVVADEVYRGTQQEGDTPTPSMADLYARGIGIGSMSKAFSLAGLRLGWMCASTDPLRAAERHRDYTTISMGMIDGLLASIAQEHRDAILSRSRAIVRANLPRLDLPSAGVSVVEPAGGSARIAPSSDPQCLTVGNRSTPPAFTGTRPCRLRPGGEPPRSAGSSVAWFPRARGPGSRADHSAGRNREHRHAPRRPRWHSPTKTVDAKSSLRRPSG